MRKLLSRKIVEQDRACAICHEEFTECNDILRRKDILPLETYCLLKKKAAPAPRRAPFVLLQQQRPGPCSYVPLHHPSWLINRRAKA
jgi:hypothetical protein